MDVEKALFLEEIVYRAANAVAHAGHGAEGVGSRPQMGDGPHKLEAVLLLLQRIALGVGPAVDGHAAGLHLGGLALAGRGLHQPLDAHAAAGGESLDLAFVIFQPGLGQHLQIAEARAVVEFQEAESGLGISPGADPALQQDFSPHGLGAAGLSDRRFFHIIYSNPLAASQRSASRAAMQPLAAAVTAWR